jgi:peptidoglycan-associated lipoprotein
MRKNLFGCLVVIALGMFLSAGCAKKQVVVGEEPVAAQPATQPQEVQKPTPPPQPEPVRPAPLPETPTQESTIPPETPKQGMQTTTPDLQSELQKIYFNFDSADLSQDARSTLSKNADLLARDSSVKIRIEGNCDERGSDDYNMALGERRAKAAKDYLVNLGVQADRISVISYGEEKPVDPGHDEAAWAKNRRDEFIIVK